MGDNAALVEQTNFRQRESAGAHRTDASRARAEALQRGQGTAILAKDVNAGATRNQQRVDTPGARQRVGNQFHARGSADRTVADSNEADCVRRRCALVIGSGQRLCGSGDIDELSAVIGENDDGPGWHFLLDF